MKDEKSLKMSLETKLKNNEENFLMEQMSIVSIQQILGYSDARSAINWCRKNGVYVLHQGKRSVVQKVEFVLAYYKGYIENLRKTYPNWIEIFVAYLQNDLKNVTELQEAFAPIPKRKKDRSGNSFLQKLSDL